MGKNWETSTRFIRSPFTPLILWIVFILVFYAIYFSLWKEWNLDLLSYKVSDFAKKYSVFIPAAYWLLSIIIHYLLCFIKWIIRLNFWIVSTIIAFIVYGFNLFLWIQLMFFEPRYTDTAIYLIDTFSKPIVWASSATLLLSIIFVFIKKK